MGKLVAVIEGSIHMLDYLQLNKVYPTNVILDPLKLQEVIPYLTDDDHVVIIINSFTDFTLTTLYNTMGKLEEMRQDGKEPAITLLTNIPLGRVPFSYYLYTGDLFYGEIVKIVDGRTYEVNPDGSTNEGSKKASIKRKKSVKAEVNPITMQLRSEPRKANIEGKLNLVDDIVREYNEYDTKVKNINLYE